MLPCVPLTNLINMAAVPWGEHGTWPSVAAAWSGQVKWGEEMLHVTVGTAWSASARQVLWAPSLTYVCSSHLQNSERGTSDYLLQTTWSFYAAAWDIYLVVLRRTKKKNILWLQFGFARYLMLNYKRDSKNKNQLLNTESLAPRGDDLK